MMSRTLGRSAAREQPQAVPQPQIEALQTALEIRNHQVQQLTEENEKLKGDFGQVRKELEGKDEVVQGMRKEMDGLIKQLVSQGSQSDELELKRELEEGRQVIRRLKAELDKAKINGATGEKISQAMEVLVLKKRKDDALQTQLGEVMEELEKIREELASMKENEKKLEGDFQRVRKELAKAKEKLERVRKDCEDQLGAMKEKEKKSEGDFQRVQDELAGTKEELRKVRNQLRKEEQLRKGSEFKLKSIRESIKMIDEAGGVENDAGDGSFQSPSRARGARDKESCYGHGRSVSGKHGLPSLSSPTTMVSSKKVKLEVEVGTRSSGNKSTDASSGEGTSTEEGTSTAEIERDTHRSLEDPAPPIPCITIDSDSDSEDGLEETAHPQQAPVIVPAQDPGRGRRRVPKSKMVPPTKEAVPQPIPSSEKGEAPKRGRSPDLETDATGVVEILAASDYDVDEQQGNVEAQVGPRPSSSTVSAPAGSPPRKETAYSPLNDHPMDADTGSGSDEETRPIETTVADPEIDTKIIPDETVLQRSALSRKIIRRQRTTRNGRKYTVSVTPRRVPVALTRLLRHGEVKEKPWYCLCGNKFANRQSLQGHVYYFGGEPQRCDICHKFYSSLNNLNIHKRGLHSKPDRRNPSPKPKLPRRAEEEIVEIGRGKEDIHGFSHVGSSVGVPSGNGAGPEVSPPMPGPSSGSGATQYFCKCGQQFPSNEAFLEHMNKIKLEGTFKCCWCPCGFKGTLGLRLHQQNFHAGKLAQNELKRKRKKNKN